jgi:hypothetical protein
LRGGRSILGQKQVFIPNRNGYRIDCRRDPLDLEVAENGHFARIVTWRGWVDYEVCRTVQHAGQRGVVKRNVVGRADRLTDSHNPTGDRNTRTATKMCSDLGRAGAGIGQDTGQRVVAERSIAARIRNGYGLSSPSRREVKESGILGYVGRSNARKIPLDLVNGRDDTRLTRSGQGGKIPHIDQDAVSTNDTLRAYADPVPRIQRSGCRHIRSVRFGENE